ncbi:MAG: beta-hydroxyacyl-ACP dehydratase [Aeoliella sp.]
MRWFWVDRFTEFVATSHAVGTKGVSLSDNFMHDHWDAYPTMPHSLIAEGMAQTSGLLVSELYDFKELVVLAKFSRLAFHGITRGGDTLTYRASIDNIRDVGAVVSVSGHVGDELRAEGEIFFARLQSGETGEPREPGMPIRLFDPVDLAHWLHLTGVFEVGVKKDGSRMRAVDYGLPTELAAT